ncbi:2Fe-2S iron-sulfur cluster-binding protein [Gloeocapsa sp. PCC 73106]|uniref:2Fe-2S iron-sulfur cluster-binding protein n=1 Tax=Gloeocapsa sp. PCC 73106 TaxID=102232 RepID=UPI0005550A05|nr:2Fe-2S iron-sulfur cluster-binding protein [Gloeocapsa sp. PCC 73106]
MTTTYTVKIHHQGEDYIIEVPEDQTVLAVAQEAGVELPSSCLAGVCTTCAALIKSGTVEQSEGMGISPELQSQGYALLCVAHPTSDLVIESEKEEIVYSKQFGKS